MGKIKEFCEAVDILCNDAEEVCNYLTRIKGGEGYRPIIYEMELAEQLKKSINGVREFLV